MRIVSLLALLSAVPEVLWRDVTTSVLPTTAEWTNRIALADIDGDGRVDLLFANGGNYSELGEPELNRVFLNRIADGELRFEEATDRVFGSTGDTARVIQVRDVDGDGNADIFVGTTFQTQSRLYLGEGGGRFRETDRGESKASMNWYGENLFRARLKERPSSYRVCATDRAGNQSCSQRFSPR